MNSRGHGSGQQSHVQQSLPRQNSLSGLTLDEVKNQLGDSGKQVGSMNLDEFLNKVWTAKSSNLSCADPHRSLQPAWHLHQENLSLVRAFSGRTVNEVWREIQLGRKMRNPDNMSAYQREPTLGETTLKDFLDNAALLVADASLGPMMAIENASTPQSFTPLRGLSPTPSMEAMSDTPMLGRKRDSGDFEKAIDRRLRRKIKNRESAARSRARKQAYHNELVSKVSRLEEEIMKLKKEKEFDQMAPCILSEPRYQLRRTSSF